jgi:nucleoside-diphosphate-sugar epimerase
MNYLVTGGAGFIGSNLVDKLLSEDHNVAVIDDFSSGKIENLEQHKENKNLTIYERSFCDDLGDIFEKNNFDSVFHLGAIPRVQYSITYPEKSHKANVEGTFNVLLNCKNHKVKRFVFSSSSSIYGNQDKLPLVEDMKPNPMSPYALHKLIGEQYCKIFSDLYNVETISLRYFNVYGPRQDPNGDYACLIPKFIDMVSKKETPLINGDGLQTRDFTYVSDVVGANILASKTNNKDCFGKIFNVGAGNSYSVNDVSSKIVENFDNGIIPIHGSAVIEPKHTLADISKTEKYLSWVPSVGLYEGMKSTVDYLIK